MSSFVQCRKNAFAIVKLWPDIKAAEDECISRIRKAAASLGIETYEVNADGFLTSDPNQRLTRDEVDFYLHLHFDTPKNYDGVSIVALWNPPDFYVDWGYERTVRNLFSHDAFVSCGSEHADGVVERLLKHSSQHEKPISKLYHSLDSVHYPPTTAPELKLFYIGINWEALSGESRHSAVLKKLDDCKKLEIYGPKIFQGIRVWKGYSSYVDELPFDGISVTKAISRCGICLVLSSDAHRRAGIMSNRLFEAISAGALVISDRNSFCVDNFGDNLLYIDSNSSPENQAQQILDYLEWANENRSIVKKMVSNTQSIFERSFSLTVGISNLYEELAKKSFVNSCDAVSRVSCTIFVTIENNDKTEISRVFGELSRQTVEPVKIIIICNSRDKDVTREQALAAFDAVGLDYEIVENDFIQLVNSNDGTGLGSIMYEHIKKISLNENFMLVRVGSGAEIHTNHVQTLCDLMSGQTDSCAVVSPIVFSSNDKLSILDNINPYSPATNLTERYLFKRRWIDDENLETVKNLTTFFCLALIGQNPIKHSLVSTLGYRSNHRKPLLTQEKNIRDLEFYQWRDILNGDVSPILNHIFPLWPDLPAILHDRPDEQKGDKNSERHFSGISGRLFSARWWWLQFKALKRYGYKSRIMALKNKITK